MKLIFMRHGYLEGKFEDYGKLAFRDYEDLLLETVHPSVDENKSMPIIQQKDFLSQIDLIFFSPSNRAVETKDLVLQKIDKPSISVSELTELHFQKGVIKPEDVLNHNNLRKVILTNIFDGNFAESLEEARTRILKVIELAKSKNVQTILCISHAWIMRAVGLMAKNGLHEAFSLQELLDYPVPKHLETIEIDV